MASWTINLTEEQETKIKNLLDMSEFYDDSDMEYAIRLILEQLG